MIAFTLVAGTDPVCDPEQGAVCAIPGLLEYVSSPSAQHCHCPQQCERTVYSYTMSQSPASKLALQIITAKTGLPASYLLDEFAILEMYYSDISYERISSEPAYGFLALLSDIGGSLGLLLGSTLLTFFEIFDRLICILWWLLLQRQKHEDNNAAIAIATD